MSTDEVNTQSAKSIAANTGPLEASDRAGNMQRSRESQMIVGPVTPPPPEWRKHELRPRLADEEDWPELRRRWFVEPRAYPHDEIPQDALLNTHRELLQIEQEAAATEGEQAAARLPPSDRWQFLGPGNVAGRVNAIAVDPRNNRIIYACTSSGGIWRSTDQGRTWMDINLGLGSNFAGAIAIDPWDSRVLYLCTGDQDEGIAGAGVYKSTNMGYTWSQLVDADIASVQWASRIIVSPDYNSDVVYLASDQGLFKSYNAGLSWDKIHAGWITDLVMDLKHPWSPTLYCGVYGEGVFKTTDGGRTWVAQECRPSGRFRKVRLALCENVPDVVYASIEIGSVNVALWRTINGGETWNQLPDPPITNKHETTQGGYNHYIAVSPLNPYVVYCGLVQIYRSTNGGDGGGIGPGKAWQLINAADDPGYVSIHCDHHCLTFDPGNRPEAPETIYCGCDGGVYRSRRGGHYWEYIGASIPSTEFYAIGHGAKEYDHVAGGTQDNGVWRTDRSVLGWQHVLGGDGGEYVVDPENPSLVYAEQQQLSLHRSDDRGKPGTFRPKTKGIMETDYRPFVGVIAMDQRNPSTLYTGTDRLYKTTDRMESWSLLPCGDNVVLISNKKGKDSLLRIEASASAAEALGWPAEGIESKGAADADGNPKTYAKLLSPRRAPFRLAQGMALTIRVDKREPQTVIFRPGDFRDIHAATAQEVVRAIENQTNHLHVGVSAMGIPPNFLFGAIRVAPSDSSVIYAAAGPQIWRSDDAGASWRSIHRPPLPDRIIKDIDVAAHDARQVYIAVSGYHTGHVFFSGDAGNSWTERSNGLPDSPANSICIDPSVSGRLWLGTDIGVAASNDGGKSWHWFSEGLPYRVVVTDLEYNARVCLLRIATHGRGVWERQIVWSRTASQYAESQKAFSYKKNAPGEPSRESKVIIGSGVSQESERGEGRTPDSTVTITGLRTRNQADNQMAFLHDSDALSLVVDLAVSPDFAAGEHEFDANYQVVDFATNKVVVDEWQRGLKATQIDLWISAGNNWGPSSTDYDTPAKWGLDIGLYVFRAEIQSSEGDLLSSSGQCLFRIW